MLSNLYTLFNLYRLHKIKEAFIAAAIPFPVYREGIPLSYSFNQFNGGSWFMNIFIPNIIDPVFEIKLMEDTASIRFLLDPLFIELEEPVRDDLVINLHKQLEATLNNCFIKTTRLQEGNIAGYYATSIPLSKLNPQTIKDIIVAAKAGINSDECGAVFTAYHAECVLLQNAEGGDEDDHEE
jgi:hypothetical protein